MGQGNVEVLLELLKRDLTVLRSEILFGDLKYAELIAGQICARIVELRRILER